MPHANPPLPLDIDIVSDVVCPWCIIGYLQLQKALTMLPEPPELRLRWHPFELNPGMAPEGEDVREHNQRKYGSTRAQSEAIRARLGELGASLGFRFDYHDGMRVAARLWELGERWLAAGHPRAGARPQHSAEISAPTRA